MIALTNFWQNEAKFVNKIKLPVGANVLGHSGDAGSRGGGMHLTPVQSLSLTVLGRDRASSLK